jgi:hypothetical protein
MKAALAALFVFMTAGLVFSAWTVHDLRRQVSDLETRVTTLADRPAPADPAPAPSMPDPAKASRTAGDSVASDPVADPETDAGAAEPVARKDGAAGNSDPSSGRGLSVNPAGWTEADRAAFEAEVLAVLKKQEEERDAKRDERQADWMMSRLKEGLKLTDQQAAEVKKIVAATMAEVDKLRATITPENRDEVRPQIQTTVQAADTQIKALLTAEQTTAYDAMKQQGNLFNFGGGGRGPDRGRRGGGMGGGEAQ